MEPTTARIRVVLVVDDLGYGGAERQVVELANGMDSEHFEVHVCTLSEHVPLSSRLRDAEHRLHVIKRRGRLDVTMVTRLARLLQSLQADIVHGYLFRAEIMSRLAGRLAGVQAVVGSERNANRAFARGNLLAYRLTQRCVDVIIANSHAGAASNARIFRRRPSDYRVIHNGVDTERFQPRTAPEARLRLGLSPDGPVIGAFANLKKQKNHVMLFRVFRRVLDSFSDARLLLVGEQPVDRRGRLDEYQAYLTRVIDDLGVRPQCLFLGHRDDVEHLYPACDLTVLPSLHEGTPNVLLESMACAIPVIATDVCDNAYIVKDEEVGYLVAGGDEAGMARRIGLLLGNRALCQKMGCEARQWAVREFSIGQLVERTATVYREVLQKKRG